MLWHSNEGLYVIWNILGGLWRGFLSNVTKIPMFASSLSEDDKVSKNSLVIASPDIRFCSRPYIFEVKCNDSHTLYLNVLIHLVDNC